MNSFRHSLVAAFVLLNILAFSLVRAQPSRVAFVKSDHSKVFFTDGQKLDSTAIIDTAAVNATIRGFGSTTITAVSKLSVLASTSNGKTLMIAGHFLFPNRVTSLQDSADAIIKLDSPFVLRTLSDLAVKFNVLKRISPTVSSVNFSIPLGAIASNDLDWYATWTGSQVGSPFLWFYHGLLTENDDGTAMHLDSVEYPTDASHQIQEDFHMTNLAISPGGNVMIGVVVDQLRNEINGPDFHAIRWEPHPPGPTQVFRTTSFLSNITAKFNLAITRRDFNFGLGIRAKDNDVAEVILAKDSLSDLLTMTYRYNDAQVLLADGTLIPRSMVPTSEYFFDGLNSEVVSTARQRGNGGDIMFLGNSDSIIFVTHSALDDGDLSKSKLRIGSVSSGSSQVLWGDGKRQPLHPVWMQGVPAAPPKHEYIALSTAQIDFGTVLFGKNSKQTITISNPSDSDVRVDSVKVTVGDAVHFTFTTAPVTPFNLAKGATGAVTITFAPTTKVGVHTATLTVYFGGHKDSLRTVTLTGNGKDTAHVGVEPTRAINSLSITPNPTRNSTTITLQASRASLAQLEVRDLLGRVVYSVEPRVIAAGNTLAVQFDAKSLGLPNGVYYLSAHIGAEQITRQLVVVR